MSERDGRAGVVAVRPADEEDVAAIVEVAHAAWRATYASLIPPEAVERFLASAYTPDRVARRIARHDVRVATLGARRPQPSVDAFLESLDEAGRVHIVALYVRPSARGRGLGSALLDALVADNPGADITADVLVGNALGEPFYVARGFEPDERLDDEVGGEPVRERRWWLRGGRR